MKSEKGITLISITIYIIAMTVVVSVMAVVSTYFYKNVNSLTDIDALEQYTKFNSYFTDEINNANIKIIDVKIEENGNSYIIFDNDVQYSFIKANKGIYRNKVKICENIDNCTFKEIIQNGRNVVIVKFESGEKKETMKYTLGN